MIFTRSFILTLSFFSCLVSAEFVLHNQPNISGEFNVNTTDLCHVSKNTQHYIENFSEDNFAVHSGNIIKILFKKLFAVAIGSFFPFENSSIFIPVTLDQKRAAFVSSK